MLRTLVRRRTTKLFAVLAGCLLFVVLVWLLPFARFFFPTQSSQVLETREFRKGENRVVITAYAEKNSFVPGAYYVFEWIDNSNKRHEIMTFRHDDRVPISERSVFFLNERIAYVFMGWMYAITTDGGKNWSVWTAERDLPHWQCCNYRLITDVTLGSDGLGVMRLNPIKDRDGEVSELHTVDYGKHWRAE
jgi:hypothetical protein